MEMNTGPECLVLSRVEGVKLARGAMQRIAVPSELRELPQFVVWKKERRETTGDLTKVPYNARTGQRAKSSDPTTWATLEEALKAFATGRYDGIGFMFANGFCGIDLDKCRNSLTGEIEGYALAIVEKLDTYTEISPSGTGLHLLTMAKLPGPGLNRDVNDHKMEIYDSKRFFTLTGNRLPSAPATINERQAEAQAFYEYVMERTGGAKLVSTGVTEQQQSIKPPLDDASILKLAIKYNGAKFDRLLAGDTSDYGGDESRADLAFAGIVTFYTPDDDQVARLWLASGLYRAKLEREDYVQRTIARARASQTASYSKRLDSDDSPAGEPAIDLTDCEEIDDGDLPISTDPSRERRLRQITRNRNLLSDTYAIYLRQLGFEKSHDRILSAITSYGGSKTSKFTATNEQLAKKYSGTASLTTVKRDKKELLDEIKRRDIAIIRHRTFPDAYIPKKGSPPSEYQNILLRKSLEAINFYFDEYPGEKFVDRAKLEEICHRLLPSFPKPEPIPPRKGTGGRKKKSEIDKAKAKISRAVEDFLDRAQKLGWSPQDVERWLVSVLRSRRNDLHDDFHTVAQNEPPVAASKQEEIQEKEEVFDIR